MLEILGGLWSNVDYTIDKPGTDHIRSVPGLIFADS